MICGTRGHAEELEVYVREALEFGSRAGVRSALVLPVNQHQSLPGVASAGVAIGQGPE